MQWINGIDLIRNRIEWKTLINIFVFLKKENFLVNLGTVTFSRCTLTYGFY